MLIGMNCDDEKTVVISSTSTTNEWPQHMIPNDHHQKSLNINNSPNNNNNMASSTMDHQKPAQDQHPQQALKCPRCDSSNTKFCYYNNYSLSQPRHFCKACKRYWTRGGTLRNVPVGGGCRKNKRLKRSSSSSAAAAAAAAANNSSPASSNLGASINNNNSRPSTDSQQQPPNIHSLLSSGQSHIGSLFYNHHHSRHDPFSRYDLAVQPHFGLAFSNNNGDTGNSSDHNNNNNNYQNGLGLSSNPLLSTAYGSIFGAAASSNSSPTIASLLASKFASGCGAGARGSSALSSNNFQALGTFEELSNEAALMNGNVNKQLVKLELDGQGRSSSSFENWINGSSDHHHQNQTDHIGLSSDPSLFWANPTAVSGGANWLDPTANIGPNSVPSLI